ncbi:MAG: hypothetical protein H6793_02530 [Candidatus Nomurabacteria bacterium]|nr:hypothetical protein [Candidatus Saccharibacteria bacterium]USN95191.1 MAG: hypothetical protein H6793_02530 [Candidatus Nomurabacteria bacterium]
MLGQSLLNKQVLSLQIGAPIGVVTEAIINPFNLKLEGWYAKDHYTKHNVILLSQDVREIIQDGMVVNDHNSLSNPDELVRLQEIIKHKFILLGMNIITDQKRRLGKVSDYAINTDNFFVQKLHVSQSIVKSFTGGALMIDRSQIIEITHKKITVSEATARDTSPMPAVA